MKKNRGITITSLVIYIVCLVIVISVMSTVTGYFYNNINKIVITQNAEEQYSRFLTYLTKDINSEKLKYINTNLEENNCIILKFDDGQEHQYIFKNGNIYYLAISDTTEKKITLCYNVTIDTSYAFNYADEKIQINFYIQEEKFSSLLNVNLKK